MNSKKSVKATDEKAGKLRSLFFVYLFDMSWKLAVSFLLPFFIALFLAKGDTQIIGVGIVVGLIFATITIIVESKHITKGINNVV